MIIIKTKVEKITTDYYRVLEMLYDNQATIMNETYCPLSQEEIGLLLGINRMTVGSILRELKDDELVVHDETKKKKYSLTKEATEIVKKIKKL